MEENAKERIDKHTCRIRFVVEANSIGEMIELMVDEEGLK
jgi:hypothetical protein